MLNLIVKGTDFQALKWNNFPLFISPLLNLLGQNGVREEALGHKESMWTILLYGFRYRVKYGTGVAAIKYR